MPTSSFTKDFKLTTQKEVDSFLKQFTISKAETYANLEKAAKNSKPLNINSEDVIPNMRKSEKKLLKMLRSSMKGDEMTNKQINKIEENVNQLNMLIKKPIYTYENYSEVVYNIIKETLYPHDEIIGAVFDLSRAAIIEGTYEGIGLQEVQEMVILVCKFVDGGRINGK